MTLNAKINEFLFGCNYYPVHFPSEEWPRDFANMARHGMNMIRTGELLCSWDRLEIKEGEPDFGWLDAAVDLAEKNGMRVLLGTGTPSPPAWLKRKYPDIHIVNSHGSPYPDGAMWNWACHNHPGYRYEAERWIRTLVARYKDRKHVVAWQINNEPCYPFIPGARGLESFDHNPYTVRKFRKWLKNKYGTIDNLNHAWKSLATNIAFGDWSEIDGVAASPSSWGVMTAWYDWSTFLAEDFAEYIRWESDLVKSLDGTRPTMTNSFVLDWNDPFGVFTGLDIWKLAESTDIIGYDLYPGLNNRFRTYPEYISFFYSMAYSVAKHTGKGFWLPELESGPIDGWLLGPKHDSDAKDVGRFAVEGIAHGVKQIGFHVWRENPCMPIHWGAPTDLDGTPNEIADTLLQLSQWIKRNEDFLVHAEPEAAQVAILYSRDSAVHLCGLEQGDFLKEALNGLVRAIWEEGYPFEFVTPDQIRQGVLSRYKVLLLPFLPSLDDAAGESIAAFVRDGGVVYGSAKAAQIDQGGWWNQQRPGAGLIQTFGVKEKWIRTKAEVPMTMVSDHEELNGLRIEGGLTGAWHQAILEPVSPNTKVVALHEDGTAAMTVHRYGRGRAVYSGTHLDYAYNRTKDRNIRKFWAWLLDSSGVRKSVWLDRPVHEPEGDVDVHRLVRGEESMILVTSTHYRSLTVRLCGHGIPQSLTDTENGESLSFEQGKNGWELELTIPERGWRMIQVR